MLIYLKRLSKYEAKLEFPYELWGGGVKPKPSMGGGSMDIFWSSIIVHLIIQLGKKL